VKDADLAFAEALSQVLGSLYRLSVVDRDGGTVATYGHRNRSDGLRSTVPLPNSSRSLVVEVDTHSVEAADRVLHAIASGAATTETSLGAIATLDSALDELIRQGEAQIGKRLPEMSRREKQQLVRLLHERGAFNLRKAVEHVAELLGVSRFTVYNYLAAKRDT
jgi:hypothetical protein